MKMEINNENTGKREIPPVDEIVLTSESTSDPKFELNEDEDLENFPNTWKYEDGWPEDKWQEEFDRHPFFMTKAPEPTDELHPLLEGLQQIKYDENDNSAEELAETYKKDGLLSFKVGKYRDAILNFTSGLKYNCSPELKSQLFNNRAASHYFLSNYRSALQDSRKAVKLNPNYMKAKLRVPQCLFNLNNYQECIDECDEILSLDKSNTKISELRKKATEKKKFYDRDMRKQKKKLKEEEKLLKAISDRSIRIEINGDELNSVSQLDPPANIPGLERVYLKENSLIWPAIIVFPESGMFECVRSFHEYVKFADILEDIFEAIYTDWDSEKRYKKDTVNVYFKDKYRVPVEISVNSTLISAQHHPQYYQNSSVPHFFVLARNSTAENEFLEECKHQMG